MRRRGINKRDKFSHYRIPREEVMQMPRYKRLIEEGYPHGTALADTRACLKYDPKAACK